MIEDLYLKFFHNYFLNSNSIQENDPQFKLKNESKMNKVFWYYISIFMFGVVLTGFAVDVRHFFMNILVLIFFLVLNSLVVWYVLSFFINSKSSIQSKGWIVYPYIFLFVLPIIFGLLNPDLYKIIAYYTFYLFFLIIYLKLLPGINFFFKNLYLMWIVLISIVTLLWKVVFVKLDQREFNHELYKLKLSKKITKKAVKTSYLKSKKKFKYFGIFIFLFTLGNIFFGFSVSGLYQIYIEPSSINVSIYIESIKGVQNGLYALVSIIYAVILLGMYVLIIVSVFLAYDYYLRTIFFDKLLSRLDETK